MDDVEAELSEFRERINRAQLGLRSSLALTEIAVELKRLNRLLDEGRATTNAVGGATARPASGESRVMTMQERCEGPPSLPKPQRRLWLIYFRESSRPAWWMQFLRPDFRHVTAISYFASRREWIVFDPASCGTAIEVLSPNEIGAVIDALAPTASAILRFPSQFDRAHAPLGSCVGAIKGPPGHSIRGFHAPRAIPCATGARRRDRMARSQPRTIAYGHIATCRRRQSERGRLPWRAEHGVNDG